MNREVMAFSERSQAQATCGQIPFGGNARIETPKETGPGPGEERLGSDCFPGTVSFGEKTVWIWTEQVTQRCEGSQCSCTVYIKMVNLCWVSFTSRKARASLYD